jgi:hypothetical protein
MIELNVNDVSEIDNIWYKYEGDFKDDSNIIYYYKVECDGFGTLIFGNGDKYVGGFR